jgi:hypothetical protein
MISWGAFAACLAKGVSKQIKPSAVCEPLASYVRGVVRVQRQRNGFLTEDDDGQASHLVTYNSPQKMTPVQCEHSAAMYYWAGIHSDDGTRVISRLHAKRSLEMYLRFGHVLLRKRAYKFHGTKKRSRRSIAQADEVSGTPSSFSASILCD